MALLSHKPAYFFFLNYLGGYTYRTTLDEILKYDPQTGQWKMVDKMFQKRASHAVSVVSDFESYC